MEQAMAVALVSSQAISHRPVRISRGGLAPARLRRITDLVQATLENELGLAELAQSVELSTAHFARMYRHDVLGYEATWSSEICSEDAPHLVNSQPELSHGLPSLRGIWSSAHLVLTCSLRLLSTILIRPD